MEDRAAELLDIENTDLFFEDSWPEHFYDKFAEAKTNKAAAKVAAEVIDSFIKTNEWEEDEQ